MFICVIAKPEPPTASAPSSGFKAQGPQFVDVKPLYIQPNIMMSRSISVLMESVSNGKEERGQVQEDPLFFLKKGLSFQAKSQTAEGKFSLT